MDYTTENGRFYKVLDAVTTELIIFGELVEGEILSTNQDVVFIDGVEFVKLVKNQE